MKSGPTPFTSGTRRVKNPVTSHEWGKDDYDYDKRNISVVICHTDKTFEVVTSTWFRIFLFSNNPLSRKKSCQIPFDGQ